jgi:ribosomal protein S18 acetylase RimI-like enzyme
MKDVALRPATTDGAEFFFALHKLSLGPYVDQIWGWDDDEQRAYMTTHLVLEHVHVIVVDGVDEYQGRGIGSRLIRELIDCADGKRVTLSVLGVNDRAYQLYRRLGFNEVSREGVAPEVRIRMVAVSASR